MQQTELIRVTNSTYGYPRYVVHYVNVLSNSDHIKVEAGLCGSYELALKKAKKIGVRKFHNNQYGGGIIFTTFNAKNLVDQINSLSQENKEFLKDIPGILLNKNKRKILKALQTVKPKLTRGKHIVSNNWQPENWDDLENTLGIAYTSTGAFAGYWVCNVEAWVTPRYRLSGIIFNSDNTPVLMCEDIDENYAYIEL